MKKNYNLSLYPKDGTNLNEQMREAFKRFVVPKALTISLLILLTFGLSFNTYSQTGTIQIGSGTQTTSTLPVTNYDYAYSQQIITAAEYGAAGGASGNITKIRYKFTSVGTIANYDNWTVYLGNTAKTSFTSNTDWVPLAQLTQVFVGTIVPVANNWFEITLPVAFNYTGGNIILAVDENSLGWTGSPTVQAYTSTANTGIVFRQDGTDVDPASPPAASSRVSIVPQIQFEGTLASCPPPTALTVGVVTPISASLAWTGVGPATDWDVEWGVAGFTPTGTPTISMTTNPTPLAGLTPNTNYQYYVRSVCGPSDMSAWAGPFNFFTGYCEVSTTYTGDYTSAFSTTGALANVTYSTSSQPVGSYADETAQTFTSVASQQIDFSHSYVGGSNGVKIWVDWNNDMDFNDVGEEVFYLANSSATKTGSFTVPAAAVAGNYRMRVRSLYGTTANPSACGLESWGSTLDYTLSITTLFTSPALTQDPATPTCLTGSSISAVGTPDPGIEWYWQTSPTGTSTAVPYTGPLAISVNGTYYLRAYDPSITYWVAASSIVVNNFPTAIAPPTPVADVNPSCAPAGSMLTVPAPAAGYEYFWQETNMGGTSNALNATTPYNATSTGTYYVAAYETATQCWSNTVGLLVTVGTVIPTNPIVSQSNYNFCVGEPSIEISANTTLPAGVLSSTLSGGNGCTNGSMFDLTANTLPITVTSLDVVPYTNGTQNVLVYYKTGTHVGSETNAGAWTLLGTYPINGTTGVLLNLDIADLTIPASTTYGIYLDFYEQYTTQAITTYADANLTLTTGSGFCSSFTPIAGRAFNGKVHYTAGVSGTLEWYSALTGNNNVGSGAPFETVGTTVLPNSSVAGAYQFYAASYLDGCYSASRELVTVNLSNVNVVLSTIDVSCNNGNDGAVVVSSVICGTAPFTFSIDGGTFGPQTGMTPGTHSVILKDFNGDDSGTYTVVIGDAPAPSAVTMTTVTSNSGDISWTATGSETEWNIEWGVPGFTPGTGTEIGSGTSLVTNYLITPLNPVTYYDVYVSANCGTGTTAGSWALLSFSTDCGPISALPWTENFDNLATLGTTSFPLCWVNENPSPAVWSSTSAALSTTTPGPLSPANYLRVRYNSDAAMWTPEFNLTAGETYEFTFNWAGDGRDAWEGSVYVNGSQSSTGATMLGTKFVEIGDPTTLSYQKETYCFTPTTSGVYAFGVRVKETGNNWYMGLDDFKLKRVITTPGIDGALSTCQTGSAVDLNTVITAATTDGTWNFALNPSAVNGAGVLNVNGVPSGVHNFYFITTGCAPDTTIATITIVQPSSAGNDGALAVCRNQPFNLLAGLTGSIDFGGVWTDPNSAVVPNGNTNASNIPGQYNYKYIVTNGVCPADTAKVVVNVQGCDYLGLNDVVFEGFSIHPNPTSEFVFIANTGSTEVFNYEVLDMNGRVILKANQAINGSTTTKLDLSKVEIGVYLIRVFNEQAEKTFRIVKN